MQCSIFDNRLSVNVINLDELDDKTSIYIYDMKTPNNKIKIIPGINTFIPQSDAGMRVVYNNVETPVYAGKSYQFTICNSILILTSIFSGVPDFIFAMKSKNNKKDNFNKAIKLCKY